MSDRVPTRVVPWNKLSEWITYGFTRPMPHVDSGVPIVTAKNVRDGRIDFANVHYTTEEAFLELSDKDRPQAGDILITKDGSIGHAAIVPDNVRFCINQSVAVIWLRACKEHRPYLLRHLHSDESQRQIQREARGVALKHLSVTDLGRIEVPLPPLPEQKRIAAILDKADAIRRKRQEAIRLTEELLRSAFLEMFGDPVTNPKGWEVKKLGEMLGFITSGSRGWATYYSDAGAKFLRIQNVGRNELLLDDLAFVTAPDGAEARRTTVHAGDIVLSITADLGRTAVVPAGFGKAHINQHLCLLRLRLGNPIFVSEYLASTGGQVQIKRADRVGVKSGLNFDDVRGLNVLFPPRELQDRFASAREKIRRHIELALAGGQGLEELSEGLTQRAFLGRL